MRKKLVAEPADTVIKEQPSNVCFLNILSCIISERNYSYLLFKEFVLLLLCLIQNIKYLKSQ
jgi:hypothetical protein